jgi:NitT/TauT family transport system ATP-binding protein
VLSWRSAGVKIVHDVDISATSPIAARSDSRFSGW